MKTPSSNKNRVLGVDPGLATTGWGVVEKNGVAIEELYFAKFAVSIAATAQARGVILLSAVEAGLDVVEYNPRAVKMAMTGFGSASKMQMQTMVQRLFRLSELPKPDDAADAMAIALCHLQTNRELLAAGSRLQADSVVLPRACSLEPGAAQ